MRLTARFALALCLLAGVFWACHLEAPAGKVFVDLEADSTWTRFDSVVVTVNDSGGKVLDTLFHGKLSDVSDLRRLPVEDFPDGKVRIVLSGFEDGKAIVVETRDFDGKGLIGKHTTRIPSDSALDIKPDQLRLYLGGDKGNLQPVPAWTGDALVWSSGNLSVATVSATGEVTAVGEGSAYIFAQAGATLRDSTRVDVVRDVPKLEAGGDTAILINSTVAFQVRVTQEFGVVDVFKWDLDGVDGWDDSSSGFPASQTVFTARPRTYAQPAEMELRFHVRDGEGNGATASRKLTVAAKAPIIDSLGADKSVLSIKDTVRFAARAGVSPGTLRSYAWDYDGDGAFEDSGSLAAATAKIAGLHRFDKEGDQRITLRVRDDAGTAVSRQITVAVKLDRPAADAGRDTAVTAGKQVNLHGTGSDSLGRVAAREWKIGAANFVAGEDGKRAFTAPATAGQVICVFRVTDDDGLTDEDTMVVTVSANPLPVVVLTPPADTLTIRDSLLFTARIKAVAGQLAKYAWDFDGDGKAEDSGAVIGDSTVLTKGRRFPAAGDFSVTLRVTDDANAVGTGKAQILVKLDSPFADAGRDTSALVSTQVNLRGTARDTLGQVRRMEWKVGGADWVADEDGVLSFTAPATPQALKCYFRVTDDDSLAALDSMTVTVTPSPNANLSALVVAPSAGTTPLVLTPAFSAAETTYAASVATTVTVVRVTPTAATAASITVNGTAVPSGTASGLVPLGAGVTSIPVVVTAQAGNKKTYTVKVTRPADTDSTLSALALSAGTLSPVFHYATSSYTVAAANNAVATTTVTATARGSNARITVNGVAAVSGSPSAPVALREGANTIAIVVTAEGGGTLTYSVTVFRPASAVPKYGYAYSPQELITGVLTLRDRFYNSSGGTVTVQETGNGGYRMVFAGLGSGSSLSGGHVQVTPDVTYIPQLGNYCQVASWNGAGADFIVDIQCSGSGQRPNNTFSVLVTWPRNASTGTNGFAFKNKPITGTGYAPDPAFSFNSGNQPIQISRPQGNPTVYFAGMGIATQPGSAMVSAVGTLGEKCAIVLPNIGLNMYADFTCRDAQGKTIDGNANVSMIQPFPAGGAMAGAFLNYRGGPPTADDAWSSSGVLPVVTGTIGGGPDDYSITFPRLGATGGFGKAGRGGNVQVSAFRGSGGHCGLGGWTATGNDFTVTVNCVGANGNPPPTDFNLWVTW